MYNKLYENIINDIAIIVKKELLKNNIFNESLLTNKQRISILKEYGIYNLLYKDLYEDFSLDSKNDLKQIKLHLGKLKTIIPNLIYRLVKIGAKKSVKLIIKTTKYLIKQGKSEKESIIYMFYGLLFLSAGLIGNTIFNYNDNPVIKNTSIEMTSINNKDSLLIHNGDTTYIIQQPNKDKAPIIKKSIVENKDSLPIKLLQDNDTKSTYYKATPEMANALKEVEKYVDHIYDAKNPSRKIMQKDMTNMSYDLTIGYGHALTKEERENWKADMKMSKEEAQKLFMKDLGIVEKQINGKLKSLPYNSYVEYSNGFIDGLISLTYNMGYGNMFGNNKKSPCEFWRRLNNCKIDHINMCMNKDDLDYSLNKVITQNVTENGHVYRRQAEFKIMKQDFGKVNPELYHLLAPEYRNSKI